MEGRDRQNMDLSTSTQAILSDGQLEHKKPKGKFIPKTQSSWERIGLASRDKSLVFNNLMGHFTLDNFVLAYKAMESSKAVGTDGITKRCYGQNLEANLIDLVERVKNGSYKPQTKREVLIPKANGKTRPIAISCFEDKLVEWILAKILSSVYEPLFIETSFGFRPFKSAHGAIRKAFLSLKAGQRPHVLEIDFANFFNSIPHKKLMKILTKRITDRRLKGLIGRFLIVGILDSTGAILDPEAGTPQGSIMSPVLANVYLHEVLDLWFEANFKPVFNTMVRYADDAVFLFQIKEDAQRCLDMLTERVLQFGIALNSEKTCLIDFSKKKSAHFHFLGFTFYWGKRLTSKVLKIKTQKAKLIKKIQEFYLWIKQMRSYLNLKDIWKQAALKLQGHYNYYGFRSNQRKLTHFYNEAIRSIFKWINRRSQIPSYSWEQFQDRLKDLPLPRPPLMSQLHVIKRSGFNAGA